MPDVARSWEVSGGGRKYVFHLRADVRWSDGTPVTAGDFEYAWKRRLDPSVEATTASLLFDIKGARAFHRGEGEWRDVGVRTLDQVTLAIELEGPVGYFLYLLAHPACYPVPRHVVEAHGEAWTEIGKIVTNGPFRLEGWQRGESMVLVRNTEYHGRFTGNLQRVELYFPEAPSVQLEMYATDRLDIMVFFGLSRAERDIARQQYIGEYISAPDPVTIYLGFDVSRPPFDDAWVRRALVLATDRETLAGVILGGYEFAATGGFVPPGIPGHSAGIGLAYNPERARQLLTEAGYPKGGGRGFPVIDALAGKAFVREIQFLQTQWREILGIEIKWRIIDWEKLSDTLDKEPPHIFLFGWMADYPDPDNFLRASPVRRYSRWRNEAYDKQLEEAGQVMDQDERMNLYRQADMILIKEAVILPLYYSRLHLLVKPWVSKYPTSAISWWFWKGVIVESH